MRGIIYPFSLIVCHQFLIGGLLAYRLCSGNKHENANLDERPVKAT